MKSGEVWKHSAKQLKQLRLDLKQTNNQRNLQNSIKTLQNQLLALPVEPVDAQTTVTGSLWY